MGAFNFLNRRPLKKADDDRIWQVLEPLNEYGHFVVQRCLNPDGSPRLVRVIDIRDRLTAEQDQHAEEIRAVARLLWRAGFDAYEVPRFLSPWGDLEIHERRARAGDRQHRHHTAGVTNTVTTRTSADITPFGPRSPRARTC